MREEGSAGSYRQGAGMLTCAIGAARWHVTAFVLKSHDVAIVLTFISGYRTNVTTGMHKTGQLHTMHTPACRRHFLFIYI